MKIEMEGGLEEGDDIPIAVAVRVAPPALDGLSHQDPAIGVHVNTATNELYLGSDRTFSFDYVYEAGATQEDVYLSSIEPTLATFLDGYNVAVIAYGASGCGKTYSLVGPDLTPALSEEQFGIIPRLVRSLFRAIGQIQNGRAIVHVSYVDIYNEEIRDLLSDNVEGCFLDLTGTSRLNGMTKVSCNNITEVLSCLETGQAMHKCSNMMGSVSSQHSIFTLHLSTQSYDGLDGATLHKECEFQVVDLAGSDQLRGGAGINLGLLALGNVVSALGDPRRNVSYVPYQDSILSRILAPALGGNTVTTMLCCISSLAKDFEESLNTLLYACRAANIRTTPVPNIVRQEGPSQGNQFVPNSPMYLPHPRNLPHPSLNPPYGEAPNNLPHPSFNPPFSEAPNNTFSPSRRNSSNSVLQFQQQNLQDLGQFQGSTPLMMSPSQQTIPGRMSVTSPLAAATPNQLQFLHQQHHNQPSHVHQQQQNMSYHSPSMPYQPPNMPYQPPNLTYQLSNKHYQQESIHHQQSNLQNQQHNMPYQQPQMFNQLDYPRFPPQQTALSPTFPPLSSPNYQPITARSTPSCISPLSHRSPVAVNHYLPASHTSPMAVNHYLPTSPVAVHNYLPASHNSILSASMSCELPTDLPMLGNQGHLILHHKNQQSNNLTEPRPAEQNLLEDGLVQTNEEIFKLQFAASQYKTLVSNAQDLLQNISQSQDLDVTDKKNIESWFCKKEESEQVIRKSGDDIKLEKIIEEEEGGDDESKKEWDEDSGTDTISKTDGSKCLDSLDSVGSELTCESVEEFDSECSDMSDIDMKLEVFEIKFRQMTDALVTNGEQDYWELAVIEEETNDAIIGDLIDLEEYDEEMHALDENDETLQDNKDEIIAAKPTVDFTEIEITRQIKRLSLDTQNQKDKVKQADKDLIHAHNQLEDLKSVIKLKESYIKDLLSTSKETERAKTMLQGKLEKLEKESKKTQRELMSAQTILKDLESKANNSPLELEYQKKVHVYKNQIRELQLKVQDIEKMLNLTQPESQKIQELILNLTQMKEQHEKFKNRLREEEERKKALEVALQKDQDTIKNLKSKLSSQEELLNESLKAREEVKVQQKWLQTEEERVVSMKEAAEQLQDHLNQREQHLKEREESLKGTLEMEEYIKKSKSRDGIEEIELVSFNKDRFSYPESDIRQEINDLRAIRDNLVLQRQDLDDKLNEFKFLSPIEERRMIELDESIEAIDSAIEYKNEMLQDKQVNYNHKYKGDDVLMQKLVKLGIGETRALLHRYFVRVLDLRLEGRKMEVQQEEMEEQYNDLGKYVRDLAHTLQRNKLDCERRLVAQQRDYQVKINLLVQQLGENGEGGKDEVDKKVKTLEKEVHYYKKLCREMRKKVGEGEEKDSRKTIREEERRVEEERKRAVKREEREEEIQNIAHEVSDYESRASSVMSHIQPSHLEQFQRRLARLHKKMKDTTPQPKVTREHKKLIIEQPVTPVAPEESTSRRGDKYQGRRRR